MAISEDAVHEALKNVIDPELFVNIVDLGLIYAVNIAEENAEESGKENAAENSSKQDISIDMTMTSPACPAGPQLIANAKSEIGKLQGAGEVEVKIVMTPPWTPDRMTEDAKDQLGIF